MELIRVVNVSKKFGEITAVKDVSFSVLEGETCVLLGPSGSGKSTILKMVNRLVKPDSGQVLYKNRNVEDYDTVHLRREMGYAVQSVGLFPHLTVEENLSILLKQLKWKKEKIDERVDYLLHLVGLEPSIYRKKFPHQLSGGEAQRVGVARALSADPPVLLMDEPFGALDPINRRRLQEEFARLKQELQKTIIFVTHDIYEAVILADKIGLIKDGVLVQFSDPAGLWQNPVNDFVVKFLGRDFSFHMLSKYSLAKIPSENGVADQQEKDQTILQPEDSLKDAISEMLKKRTNVVFVKNGNGFVKKLTFEDILNFIADFKGRFGK